MDILPFALITRWDDWWESRLIRWLMKKQEILLEDFYLCHSARYLLGFLVLFFVYHMKSNTCFMLIFWKPSKCFLRDVSKAKHSRQNEHSAYTHLQVFNVKVIGQLSKILHHYWYLWTRTLLLLVDLVRWLRAWARKSLLVPMWTYWVSQNFSVFISLIAPTHHDIYQLENQSTKHRVS